MKKTPVEKRAFFSKTRTPDYRRVSEDDTPETFGLFGRNCAHGAGINARAAIYTSIGVNDVVRAAFADRSNRAAFDARTACNACIADLVSHGTSNPNVVEFSIWKIACLSNKYCSILDGFKPDRTIEKGR